MINIKFILNRYKYVLIGFIICIFIYFFNNNLGASIFSNVKSSILQMLGILPGVMILLSLLEEWVPREYFIKYMGNKSGLLGIFLSFALACFAAGPMYAAFPFAKVLMDKGVRFSNIIIFLNAWCVVKISTLTFEISAIGYEFTLVRLVIDIVGVIVMGYLVDYLYNKKTFFKKRVEC
ncbi:MULTISPECIES: permease [unclassified Romboutsia]|uniref:permease n=1 Tax=unclassified Romboutsia TaxID=2626894 RepID=UPI00189A8683|nr:MULTISPECIES: permease [unclassified Romboutsia]MDB8803711.1 permease [Romboutsia sp. 1001216sp1]MDB8806939.1 permease [Romboutsia sp. 1001216sp1]MDB8809358.1 permease [Romboutsia sp. 1001216sp1]MDB8815107.1 permease [Romboutsia sp. 1001216sp1]MDB8817800.1 permease [Romboutsia sp. 1001216sp1]